MNMDWICLFCAIVFATFVGSRSQLACPARCSCLGMVVDCSESGLTEVPTDLPVWVTTLELQSNQIRVISQDSFPVLNSLEELDLSGNQLNEDTFNASVFLKFPQLKTLKLSYNEFTVLPSLDTLANLTHLYVQQNSLWSFPSEVLQSCPQLRLLDASFNQLTRLTIQDLPTHYNLRQLTLANNKILEIESGALGNLKAINWVKLNKNRLAALPKNLFTAPTTLKILDLNRNRITEIEGLCFNHLTQLTSLKLRRNALYTLHDAAFFGLQNMIQLQLDYNNITQVSHKWLFGLDSLEQLSIAHNMVESIEANGWKATPRLVRLDLKYNRLTQLQNGAFTNLGQLQNLHVSHNSIITLVNGTFAGLNSLSVLELNNNEITWVGGEIVGVFRPLSNLVRLDLHANQIHTLVTHTLAGLRHVRHLHLHDNPISSIQRDVFNDTADLQELTMNTSSLLCDCHAVWIPAWLISSVYTHSPAAISMICAHPPELRGMPVAEIQPHMFTCDDMAKPMIKISPESTTGLRGESISLHCTAASSSGSTMTVQWRHNNVVLGNRHVSSTLIPLRSIPRSSLSDTPTAASPSQPAAADAGADGSAADDVTASSDDGDEDELHVSELASVLRLESLSLQDEGDYQCVVSNALGATYSHIATLQVHVLPSFTSTPVNVTVRAGGTARLPCGAEGLPTPQVSWQKDGGDFPAALDRRLHVMTSDDVFFILKVKPEDQGVYSCTASNAAGSVVANATLIVEEMPAFVRPMSNEIAEEGSTAVLECMASGNPPPQLTWRRDDKVLTDSPRYYFVAGRQLFLIVDVRSEDAGVYTCVISNKLGSDQATASLTVMPKGSGIHKGQRGGIGTGGSDRYPVTRNKNNGSSVTTTTGIIVIAVVCCVVGTSLVWVVIIYQTRSKAHRMGSSGGGGGSPSASRGSSPQGGSGGSEGASSTAPLRGLDVNTSFTQYRGIDLTGHDYMLPTPSGRGQHYNSMAPVSRDQTHHTEPLDHDDIRMLHHQYQQQRNDARDMPRRMSGSDSAHSTHSTQSSTGSNTLLRTFHPNTPQAYGHTPTKAPSADALAGINRRSYPANRTLDIHADRRPDIDQLYRHDGSSAAPDGNRTVSPYPAASMPNIVPAHGGPAAPNSDVSHRDNAMQLHTEGDAHHATPHPTHPHKPKHASMRTLPPTPNTHIDDAAHTNIQDTYDPHTPAHQHHTQDSWPPNRPPSSLYGNTNYQDEISDTSCGESDTSCMSCSCHDTTLESCHCGGSPSSVPPHPQTHHHLQDSKHKHMPPPAQTWHNSDNRDVPHHVSDDTTAALIHHSNQDVVDPSQTVIPEQHSLINGNACRV